MPLPPTRNPLLPVVAVWLAVLILSGGTAPPSARADWPWAGLLPQKAEVGTPEWWKKNKKKSQFVPGKGYTVPDVEGFFDQDGRPITRPVAAERIKLDEEEGSSGLIPGLDPRVAYGKVKTAVGLGPNDQIALKAFREGEQLFAKKRYASAARKFEVAANRAVISSLKQDAMFMLGESHFFNDRYIKARDAYNALVQEYPSTRYMDQLIDREWKIARYWEEYEEYRPDWPLTVNMIDRSRPKLDTIGHAIKTYENIRMNDPTGPRADDAIMATAGIYFGRKRYEDADYHYTLLRREYPRSEYQFEAHLVGLQAKLRRYQGADYDGTPLEEAKLLVKQLRVQFAGDLSDEERDRLRVVNAQLNQEIASRDYRMAKYYDDTKHFGAARVYYAEVIKKHPDSELAQEARQRITQIAGRPENPPKRLGWLVDLLPESRERTAVARIPELQKGGLRFAEASPASTNPGDGSQQPTTVQ